MPTYKEAYNAKTAKGEAARKKYKNFSDFEKAAKSYNTKKYGTTSPTAEAKKQGISKQKLAASVDIKKDIKNSGTFDSSGSVKPIKADKIETKDNSKIRSTVSLANNNKSLLENKRGKKEDYYKKANKSYDKANAKRQKLIKKKKKGKISEEKAKRKISKAFNKHEKRMGTSYKEFKAANPGKETHGGVVYKGKKGASFGAGYTEDGSTKDGRVKNKVFDTKGRKLATVKQKKSGEIKIKKTLAGRVNEIAFKNNNKKQSLGDKLTSMTNSPRNQQAALNVAKGLKSLYKN